MARTPSSPRAKRGAGSSAGSGKSAAKGSTPLGRHAIYPISANPPTWGHADVLQRAARIFDQVTWAMGFNPKKVYAVPVAERLAMMQEYVRHLNLRNVTVEPYQGATVRFAQQIGAGVIVKGLRGVDDLTPELEQAFGNRGMVPEIETVVLLARPENATISSSLIRELCQLGENIDTYVLPAVAKRLNTHLGPQS